MIGDPRRVAIVLGSSIITAAILYVVTDEVLVSQNVTGGLWDLGLFLISVVPVAGAIVYIFNA